MTDKPMRCRYCGRLLHYRQVTVRPDKHHRSAVITNIVDDEERGECRTASGAITCHAPERVE